MATALSDFEALILPDVIGCPSFTLTHATRQSIIEFCRKAHVLKKDFEFTLTSEELESDINNFYDIDLTPYVATTEYLKPFSIERLNLNGSDYHPIHKELLENATYLSIFASQDSQSTSSDVKYFYFYDNDTIRIFDLSGFSTLFLSVVFKPLQTATSVPTILYEDYLEPIIAGAKYRLLSMPNKGWTDPEAAMHNRGLFREGLSEAKVQVNQGFGQKNKHVQPRSFV